MFRSGLVDGDAGAGRTIAASHAGNALHANAIAHRLFQVRDHLGAAVQMTGHVAADADRHGRGRGQSEVGKKAGDRLQAVERDPRIAREAQEGFTIEVSEFLLNLPESGHDSRLVTLRRCRFHNVRFLVDSWGL